MTTTVTLVSPPETTTKPSLPAASVRPEGRPYFRWKYRGERLLAALLLLPALPWIGLLGLAVRLTSRGPAIYRQRRLGLGGREFTIYKLRTMRADAEAATGAVWAAPNDGRTTALGRFLRATHLDELPQLWNVVRGEMALIGPRPERPEIAARLAEQIPDFPRRLCVRPGISGLAQINLPPDVNVAASRLKLALDLRYIDEAGPALDARIAAWTALRLMGMSASTLTRALGLYRDPRSPSAPPGRNGEVAPVRAIRKPR